MMKIAAGMSLIPILVTALSFPKPASCELQIMNCKKNIDWTRAIPVQRMVVVVSEAATDLESYASDELVKYLRLLFDINISKEHGRNLAKGSVHQPAIILGTPQSNPLLVELLTRDSVPFDEETPGGDGYIIKSATYKNQNVLLIGGSNENGVLYGVYEFLQLYGIRFYSTGDVLPDNPNPFSLPVLDFREKPYFRIRGLNNFLNMDVIDYTKKQPADYPFKEPYMDYGFVQWNDYARFFDQMAKLRFNYIHFGLNYIYLPGHDFIPQYWHFEYKGLGTVKEGLPGSTSILRQAMAYAKKRGFVVAVGIDLTNVPPEIRDNFGELSDKDTPDWRDVTDPVLQEMERMKVRTLRETFPDADYLLVWSGEAPAACGNSDCVSFIDKYRDAYGIDYDSLRKGGYHLTGYERFEHVALLNESLLKHPEFLTSLHPAHLGFGATGMTSLYPFLDRILPSDMIVLTNFSHSDWALPDRIDDAVPGFTGSYDRIFNTAIGFDMIQDYPQGGVIPARLGFIKAIQHGFDGFHAGYWRLCGYEHLASYISTASWNPMMTEEDFFRDFVTNFYGVHGKGIDYLVKAYFLLEDHSCLLNLPYGTYGPHLRDSIHKEYILPILEKYGDRFDYQKNPYSYSSKEAMEQVLALFQSASRFVNTEGGRKRIKAHISNELRRIIADEELMYSFFQKAESLKTEFAAAEHAENKKEVSAQLEQALQAAMDSRNAQHRGWWPSISRYMHDYGTEILGKLGEEMSDNVVGD